MTEICCDELVLRSSAGELLCAKIAEFILGEEEHDNLGVFRDVALSMNDFMLAAVGNRIEIWNIAKDRKALTFTVTRTHPDPQLKPCKIEGRVYVRPN